MMTHRFGYDDRSKRTNLSGQAQSQDETILRLDPAEIADTGPESDDLITAVPAMDLDTMAPQTVYLPVGYEPKYPYPLIVWLQPTGLPEPNLRQIMPILSERNYIGMVARLRFAIPDLNAFRLDASGSSIPALPWNWMTDLRRDVLQVKRCYHVHSERIYVAGVGPSAFAAIQLLLEKPEWLAGAIALDPEIDVTRCHLRNFGKLAGKRLMTTSVMRDQNAWHLQRLCHSAGMNVMHKNYPTEHSLHRRVLRDLDHWIMSDVCQPQMV